MWTPTGEPYLHQQRIDVENKGVSWNQPVLTCLKILLIKTFRQATFLLCSFSFTSPMKFAFHSFCAMGFGEHWINESYQAIIAKSVIGFLLMYSAHEDRMVNWDGFRGKCCRNSALGTANEVYEIWNNLHFTGLCCFTRTIPNCKFLLCAEPYYCTIL